MLKDSVCSAAVAAREAAGGSPVPAEAADTEHCCPAGQRARRASPRFGAPCNSFRHPRFELRPQRAEVLFMRGARFCSPLLILVACLGGGMKQKAKKHLSWQRLLHLPLHEGGNRGKARAKIPDSLWTAGSC